MLSANVIYAIHVLQELDKQKEKVTSRTPAGCHRNEFGTESEFERLVLRRVLRILLQARYITLASNQKYVLMEDPTRITLLDLVRLFHGDVCIGEAFDHYLSVGMERFQTHESQRVLSFEKELQEEITRRLQAVCISDFSVEQSE